MCLSSLWKLTGQRHRQGQEVGSLGGIGPFCLHLTAFVYRLFHGRWECRGDPSRAAPTLDRSRVKRISCAPLTMSEKSFTIPIKSLEQRMKSEDESRHAGPEATRGWDIDDARREQYRGAALAAHEKKKHGRASGVSVEHHPLALPRLSADALMPQQPRHDLAALSLFSGGGGLDIGFERAGFRHVACYELLPKVVACLTANRPGWAVRSGEAGDVRGEDWTQFRGVDVMFGGPPCQPYSQAGEQNGKADSRDMVPAYVNAIQTARPRSFLLENVATLLNPMFAAHLTAEIVRPLASTYQLRMFTLDAEAFGVPQVRRRAFIVGFLAEVDAAKFHVPVPTHRAAGSKEDGSLRRMLDDGEESPLCMGAREALGLKDIGVDGPAPTLRSGLTGKRFTTSIVSGQASLKRWTALQIWPNGVARTSEDAQLFPTPNGHFRLSVPDCALLQGFPEAWEFPRQAYLALGIIGNSVCPPVAFKLARAIYSALAG